MRIDIYSKSLIIVFVLTVALIGFVSLKNVHAQDKGSLALTQETQAAITPAMALTRLKEGNKRFVTGNMINRDLMSQVEQTSTGQYPMASVVSCLDSRIAPEYVFDQGIGDIFVARIAGNFVNDDILGSLEFASKIARSKLIVIMGHTECGAIKGACDGAELGLLTTSTLSNIKPAVEAIKPLHKHTNSGNAKFVQDVAIKNVKLNMQKLPDRSQILHEMLEKGEIKLVGAMYDVRSGKVTFYE